MVKTHIYLHCSDNRLERVEIDVGALDLIGRRLAIRLGFHAPEIYVRSHGSIKRLLINRDDTESPEACLARVTRHIQGFRDARTLLITTAQAAVLALTTPSHIRKLVADHRFPVEIRGGKGRLTLIHEHAFLKFLADWPRKPGPS